jgi:hypothetical protein
VSEARLLLRDWLVIFAANHHRNGFMKASAEQLAKLPVSAAAAGADTLSLHSNTP